MICHMNYRTHNETHHDRVNHKDWYLPSKEEFALFLDGRLRSKVNVKLNEVGGTQLTDEHFVHYWTSSQQDPVDGKDIGFYGPPSIYNEGKDTGGIARCIRDFTY